MPCRSGTGRPRATGPTRSSTRWLTWGGRSPRRGVFSLRAGGFVLCGQDWDTFVIDSSDPELTRTIVRKRGEQVPSPRAARQYRNLLLDAGFRDVTVEVHTGVFTDGSFLPVLTRLAQVCREHGGSHLRRPMRGPQTSGNAPGPTGCSRCTDLHRGGDQPLRELARPGRADY